MDTTVMLAENSFSVFILYLVISSNFLAPLFSCRLQKFIEDNMMVRHVLGFLTLTFFVVLTSKTNPLSFSQVIGFSALFYSWFLLSTRMPLYIWFIVIILLGIIYLIHLYESEFTTDKLKEDESARLKIVKEILASAAAITTVIGFLSYYGEKKIEYKDNFKLNKFLLGVPSCKGKSPKIGFFESLKAVFRK